MLPKWPQKLVKSGSHKSKTVRVHDNNGISIKKASAYHVSSFEGQQSQKEYDFEGIHYL